MNAAPFISIVIATRDRPAYLLDCLLSITDQSYAPFEILIVDQSAVRSLERSIKERFPDDARIQYFHLDKGGLSDARNLGVAKATGEVVAFIDDDAIAWPAWLEGIAEAFTHPLGPALVGGRIKPLWPMERPEWLPSEREFLFGLYDIGDELRPMPDHDLPVGANMAGLRNVILDAGGFDRRFGFDTSRKQRQMLAGEDSLLAERIKRLGHPLCYQPKATVEHRISRKKVTRLYYLRRHFWEGVTTIERMAIMRQVSAERWKHNKFHLKAAGMALARWALPGFENRYPRYKRCEIRMLAAARFTYHCGVIYGLAGLKLDDAIEFS